MPTHGKKSNPIHRTHLTNTLIYTAHLKFHLKTKIQTSLIMCFKLTYCIPCQTKGKINCRNLKMFEFHSYLDSQVNVMRNLFIILSSNFVALIPNSSTRCHSKCNHRCPFPLFHSSIWHTLFLLIRGKGC